MELFSSVRPFYFLTFNSFSRANILADAEVFETFNGFVQQAYSGHAVAFKRFVIIPDHIHVFVAFPRDGPRLVSWVKSLKSVLGKTLGRGGIGKPRWQEVFLIMSCEVPKAIRKNGNTFGRARSVPVRPQAPEEWPWQGEIIRIKF